MTASPSSSAWDAGRSYLEIYLEPLQPFLSRRDVTDLYINRPGEIWLETLGGAIERKDAPELTEDLLWRLSRQIASMTNQGINREHPILSATLPGGARVQIVAPPASHGSLALAFRQHLAASLRLSDFEQAGLFSATGRSASLGRGSGDGNLAELVARGHYASALSLAVRSRKNILISGGTSTGKTTFLNALISEIPMSERLIIIEDTPELAVAHSNSVRLIATRGSLGETLVGAVDLLGASMRMRPDRVILGELRGAEAFAFLRAVNSGHPGSMTTIHADSPASAVEQLVLLVLQAGTTLKREDIRAHIDATIDVFVQLARHGGVRSVESITVAN